MQIQNSRTEPIRALPKQKREEQKHEIVLKCFCESLQLERADCSRRLGGLLRGVFDSESNGARIWAVAGGSDSERRKLIKLVIKSETLCAIGRLGCVQI